MIDWNAVEPAVTEEYILKLQKSSEAKQYLLDTDWYSPRFTETGIPIPEDIKAKRAAARLLVINQ